MLPRTCMKVLTAAALLVPLGCQVQGQSQPQEPKAAKVTKEQVEKLLAQLEKARLPKDKHAIRMELAGLDESAIPLLTAIADDATSDAVRKQMARDAVNGIQVRLARAKLPVKEDKILRAKTELTSLGRGYFFMWMEVENLTGNKITVKKPALAAKPGVTFQANTWFDEEAGVKEWDGILAAKEKKQIWVRGTWADPDNQAGAQLKLKVTLNALKFDHEVTVPPMRDTSDAPKCPCGCDRSEEMLAELRGKEPAAALAAIEIALGEIAKREARKDMLPQTVDHRLRLLQLAEEIRARKAEITN